MATKVVGHQVGKLRRVVPKTFRPPFRRFPRDESNASPDSDRSYLISSFPLSLSTPTSGASPHREVALAQHQISSHRQSSHLHHSSLIIMGFIFRTIRRATTVGLIGATGGAAYLAAKNPVVSPLPASDPIWSSSLYKKHNPSRNPATQDVCIKRIPLEKIRPELLQKDGDLALEFCRGVWSGWGMFLSLSLLSRLVGGIRVANMQSRFRDSAKVFGLEVAWPGDGAAALDEPGPGDQQL